MIEFKGVSKTFNPGQATQFTALKDINFTIEDVPDYGEFIAIVGPLGLRQVHDPEPDPGLLRRATRPRRGEVLVRGQKVSGPGRDRGMIFQKYSSFPHRTVLENVTFGLELNQDELKLGALRARRRARASGSSASASAGTSTSTRTSSRAASSSASRSRARWC